MGRDKSNDWVLPHAKVSSRHALITYRNGAFFIEDRSRNGVFLNSTTNRLAAGRPQALQSGDVLFIEPYEIQVSVTEDASESALQFDQHEDPFANKPMAAPAGYAPSAAEAEPVPGDDEFNYEVDPLKLLGGDPEGGDRRPAPSQEVVHLEEIEKRPLAGAYQAPRMVTPPPTPEPPPAAPPSVESMLIPEDYDPLKDEIVPDTPVGDPFEPPASRDLFVEQPAEVEERVDRVTPAPAAAAQPPVVEDPFASAPIPEVPPAPPPVPVIEEEPPLAVAPSAAAPPVIAPSAAAPGGVAPQAPVAAGAEPPSAPVGGPEAPPRGERAEPKPGGDLAAVLAGVGLHNVEVSPELAENFGRILTVVVSGVMDLLRARQQVKDELRMRQTQFRPVDNNPLKFSANVEDALHNLLVKRNAAYLKPVEAFGDAFDDLRDHQLAMLAGLRVAFEAMLAEFDPARLEEQFNRQLKKGALLSVPAKLRYWDAYRDRTEHLLRDMDATFRKWFGEEFVKAYEEQLERLEVERRDRTP